MEMNALNGRRLRTYAVDTGVPSCVYAYAMHSASKETRLMLLPMGECRECSLEFGLMHVGKSFYFIAPLGTPLP